MGFSRTEHWSEYPFPSPGDHPNPGIELRSPTLQADSLPAEPQEKPKNSGVGSLSHLPWIFPTQDLNQGLLHCRQILYQVSYQGSPGTKNTWINQDTVLAHKIPTVQGRNNSTVLSWWCRNRPWWEYRDTANSEHIESGGLLMILQDDDAELCFWGYIN